MKIIKFYRDTNALKLRVDGLEDLCTIQRIIFQNDFVKSETERMFRASESDVGELKKVVVKILVEKTELDKNALRLRVLGRIVEGRPLDYIKLNSYHTLNIAPGDTLEIFKMEWPDYLIDVIKSATANSKRARLGIIVIDDEKFLSAYILGYGVAFRNEVYSNLSKKLSPKDFQEQQNKYFKAVIEAAEGMDVDTVIIAGPGFTKDDVKKYMSDPGTAKRVTKKIIFESVSNAEKSGVYELIKSDKIASILERETIRSEFMLMEKFLSGLELKVSFYGVDSVSKAIDEYSIDTILVNDSMLGNKDIQELLDKAGRHRIAIVILNSIDEVGQQLHFFKDIAGLRA